jgi:oxygen-independent coproporphyrinogen-3 oxidase
MQVYIHYPYCATLCPYCDFFSTTAPEDAAYGRTVEQEIDLWARYVKGPVTSVYLGGGTPGRMAPELCRALLEKVDRVWGIDASAEITLEANPDDASLDVFRDFAAVGINRLSLGLQSLNDAQLKWLGRRHDAAAGRAAVVHARKAGFDNLSLDLIFGLPDQDQEQLAGDLRQFMALGAEHLSLYGLTVEEGTHFGAEHAAGRLVELDRALWLSMYAQVAESAFGAGFHRYEISNFARPGYCSRHNRGYWRDRTFVGVGPGAHGQRQCAGGELERRFNPRSLKGWRARVDAWSRASEFLPDEHAGERLSAQHWLREASMLGLRDLDLGIDPASWAGVFGLVDPSLLAVVGQFEARGMLTSGPPFRLTEKSLHCVDYVASELLNA